MTRLEYRISALLLRILGWLFSLLPHRPRRVVLATARVRSLDGNLLHLQRAIRRLRPDLECIALAEPYGYGLCHKLTYAARLVRGMYLLRTAGLFVVDNAYLPIHVAPHAPRTTVVQVWHAVGALKRFGRDSLGGLDEPEQTFLHRYYDFVVTTAEASCEPWSRAFATPLERVLPLGTPRTDFFFDPNALAAARARVLARHPILEGRRVILYAPTFRGRGHGKRAAPGLDAAALRGLLGPDDILVLKSHPNLDPATVSRAGFDLVADPAAEINDLLVVADVLVTDYSSSIFEYALLRRPMILLVPDLEAYAADPGLYLDFRTDMIGTLVVDTDGVAAALRTSHEPDGPAWDAFIDRHLGPGDGRASERFVEHFLPLGAGS